MNLYTDISKIYRDLFPLNKGFLGFVTSYAVAGKSILDLGCADGRYVHELSSYYSVTGIDADSSMIEMAKKTCKGTFYNYAFDEISKLNGKFGCAFCIGNSLAYLPSEGLAKFFGNLANLLIPDGYLIIQLVNWDKFKEDGWLHFPIKTTGNDLTFIRSYTLNPDGTVNFNTELKSSEKTIDSWDQTLYPKYSSEITDELISSGFIIEDLFGNYDKSAYDPSTSPALVVIAKNTSGN